MELTFDGIRLNSPFYNETHKEWKNNVLRPFLNIIVYLLNIFKMLIYFKFTGVLQVKIVLNLGLL